MDDWIAYIKSNENEALRKLYAEFKDNFIAYIIKGNKVSHEEGIEIFQNSVIILYDNVIQNKIDHIDNMKSYLFTIGRNKAYELFRRNKKNVAFETVSFVHYVVEDGIKEKIELEKNIEVMQQALRRLGDPCKTLLELFYFKKLRNNEIAQLMDYQNENTVKTKKYKCIIRARKLFTNIKAQSND